MRTSLLALLSIVAFAVLAPWPATAGTPTAPVVDLPPTSGPYETGARSLELRDRSRRDPYTGERSRRVMVTLWYPSRVRRCRRAPYAEPAVLARLVRLFAAPEGTVLRSRSCRRSRVARGRHPLVVFSHGFTSLRSASTALTEDLASHGYVVASIDHVGDAILVQFPSGRRVEGRWGDPLDPRAGDVTDAEIAANLATRVGDARFVASRLLRLSRARGGALSGHLDARRVGIAGHSLGGATAAAAMAADRRFRAGANLDGGIDEGRLTRTSLDRPFLMFKQSGFRLSESSGTCRFLARQRRAPYVLDLERAVHYSFTDRQVAVPALGRALPALGRVLREITGIRDDPSLLRSQRAYLAAFFDRALRGRSSLLPAVAPRRPRRAKGHPRIRLTPAPRSASACR